MATAGGTLSATQHGGWEEGRCRWENCGSRLRFAVGRKCVTCDRCYHVTCLRCNASHEGDSCKTYQKSIKEIRQREVPEETVDYVHVTCRASNCDFQTVVEVGAAQMTCGRCACVTCLRCDAVHEFKTCDEFQAGDLVPVSERGTDDAEETITLQCDACSKRGKPEDMGEVYPCRHTVCTACSEKAALSSPTYLVGCPVQEDSQRCHSYISEGQLAKHVSKDALAKRDELKGLPLRRCATKDCVGKCNVRAGTGTFQCDRCRQVNCVECGTIHAGMNCREHIEWIVAEQEGNYAVADLITRLGLKEDGLPCATKGCTGVGCTMDEGSYCSICGQYTCLECRVVHDFETCDQYKSRTCRVQPVLCVRVALDSEDDSD